MRRGEIAISVIIIIALGLIVLSILGVLLITQGENFGGITTACQDTYGGSCMGRQACQDQGGKTVNVDCADDVIYEHNDNWGVWSFPEGGAVCCVTR